MDEHTKGNIVAIATVKGELKGITEVEVALDKLEELAQKLLDSGYNHLTSLSAVDYPDEDRIDLYYHVTSYDTGHTMEIKTSVSPRGNEEDLPKVPSLTRFWPMIDWHERENYDLMGIKFTGHPNLKRILLPEDWGKDGQDAPHPLRKDVEIKRLRFQARELPKEGLTAAKELAERRSRKK
ncbi:MAG: NADH-quinone oxidoreductase subunit C [Candidatus Hodarchaeota archaeon]